MKSSASIKNIPLSQPFLTSLEQQFVHRVLDGSQLSLGPMLTNFETTIARYVQSQFAIAVNSGTSALHLCLKALNIKEGDQVITTPFSFISSANCILFEKATPVFVDIDPMTYNMDVSQIPDKITPQTEAILPVHIFGMSCDMLAIQSIAEQYHLNIIEDACEAIGTTCEARAFTSQHYDNERICVKNVGTIGHCGTFAFYPNKQITTGEGGMIVTNDENVAMRCRSLRNQGRSTNSDWLEHSELGYNYRLAEINCALGLAQLKKIKFIIKKRARIATWYHERLHTMDEIFLPIHQSVGRQSWFVYVIRLGDNFNKSDRNRILQALQHQGIESRSYFPPIHLQPFYVKMFGYKRGDFPNAEHVAERTIALPFFTGMTEAQVDRVCSVFKRVIRQIKTTPPKQTASLQAHLHA